MLKSEQLARPLAAEPLAPVPLPLRKATLFVLFSLVLAKTVPLGFASDALPAIFRAQGLALEHFWLFGFVWVPWWLKWWFAPLLDRFGHSRFGLRKTWLVPTTILGACLYASLGFSAPGPGTVATIVFIIILANCVMAVQDVALDAYCVESLTDRDRSVGTGILTLGSRIGTLIASAGLLACYQFYGWSATTAAAAVFLLAFTVPMVLHPEPARPRLRTAGENRSRLIRFFRRPESKLVIPFVLLMGLNTGLHWGVSSALLVDLGLDLTEIGLAISVSYIAGLTVATMLTGFLVRRLGNIGAGRAALLLVIPGMAPLIWVASLDEATTLTVMVTYTAGMLFTAVAYILTDAARYSWARGSQAATDYAIQSSFNTIGLSIGTAIGGPLAAAFGWALYRVVDALTLGLVVIVYLVIHERVETLVNRRLGAEEEG